MAWDTSLWPLVASSLQVVALVEIPASLPDVYSYAERPSPQCAPVRHRRYDLYNDLLLAAAARGVKELLHCPHRRWYCHLDRHLPLLTCSSSWVSSFGVVSKEWWRLCRASHRCSLVRRLLLCGLSAGRASAAECFDFGDEAAAAGDQSLCWKLDLVSALVVAWATQMRSWRMLQELEEREITELFASTACMFLLG